MQFKTAYNVFKIVLAVILVEISVVNCVSEEELFAFGEDVDDNYMASGDETFEEVDLPSIFYYLEDEQESLVVHSNGFISFAAPIPGFREDLKIPFYHPYIAPFYADVDTTVSGRVYHRKTRDANLLEKATTYIRKAFPYHQFQLEWLFIATWSGVGHYKGASDQVNTFQTVLASGREKSYVLILYPTAGISWFQMEGRHSGEMVLAQAGLDAGSNNQYYLLPGQGTPDIRYLDRKSNIGEEGVWVFSVGKSSDGQPKIEAPNESDDGHYHGHPEHYPEQTEYYPQNPDQPDHYPEQPDHYPERPDHYPEHLEHPDHIPGQPDHYPEQPDHYPEHPDHYPRHPEHYPEHPDHYPERPDHYPERPDHYPERPDHYPERPDHYPERPDHYPERPDHYPERPDHYPEQPDLYPERPDHYPERPDLYPEHPDHYPEHPDHYPEHPDHSPKQPDHYPEHPDHYPERPDHYPEQPDHNPEQPDHYPEPPAQYPEHPDHYPEHPDHYPRQPDYYPEHPDHYPGRPEHYPEQPDPHPEQPDPYPGLPAHYPEHPDHYPEQPGQPDHYPEQPDTRRYDHHPEQPEHHYPEHPDPYPRQPDYYPEHPDHYPRQPDYYPEHRDHYPGRPEHYPEQPDPHPEQPDPYPGPPAHYPEHPDHYPEQPGQPDHYPEQPGYYPEHPDESGNYPYLPYPGQPDQPGHSESHIDYQPPAHPTCSSQGSNDCRDGATCVDYSQGYCCVCQTFYIGNGIDCMAISELNSRQSTHPLKITIMGSLQGTLNGQNLRKNKVYSVNHINTGRNVINIHSINKQTKNLFPMLFSLTSITGFLFGLPTKDSLDVIGFNLLGAQFEVTTNVQFSESRHFLTIKQKFTGIKEKEKNIACEIEVNGEVPDMNFGSNAFVKPTEIEYKSVGLGRLKSRYTQSLTAGPNTIMATVDEEIEFLECKYHQFDARFSEFKVALSKISILPTAQALRFTLNSQIFTKAPREDPCKSALCHPLSTCQPDDAGSYRCLCRPGYQGNGWDCEDVDECYERTHDCHADAHCINREGSYECSCADGFHGDGRSCEAVQQRVETCRELRNCHEFGECQYDHNYNRYQCVCKPGFRGDGYHCDYESHHHDYDCSANPGVCHHEARCNFDHNMRRYTCQCLPDFDGDGRACVKKNCNSHPEICSVDAHCVRQGYDFVCVCNPGFHGDGMHSCTYIGGVEASGGDEKLVYAQGMFLGEISSKPYHKESGKYISYTPGQLAVAVDTNCANHDIYWTDASHRCIKSSRADGSNVKTVVDHLSSPEGIAIDWISGNIYWTDSGTDMIQVSKLDGSNVKTLFSQNITNPRAIAVDPLRGLLFWSDWSRTFPRIERSNLDGTERKMVVTDNLGLPNGLALDLDSQFVCWSDAGKKKIECTTYEGRNRRVVHQDAGYAFGLAYHSNMFYWTDWERANVVKTASKHSSLKEDIGIPQGSSGKLYGVTVAKSSCPHGTNPCSYKDGGCRYLCFASLTGGRTCACPDSIREENCHN